MYIASFRIENYKSFRTTDTVSLTSGFNVIVGQNNVGKTALVEALSLAAPNTPHRSLAALPTTLTPLRGDSLTEVIFRLDDIELRDLLRDVVSQPRYLPIRPDMNPQQSVQAFENLIGAANDLRSTFQGGGLSQAFFQNYARVDGGNINAVQFDVGPQGIVAMGGAVGAQRGACCDFQLAVHLQRRVYAFKAERLNIGSCHFGTNVVLQQDARNLAEVLNNLQADPVGFDELNQLFSLIFPSVKRVTIRSLTNDQVEILIWTVPPDTRRLDLAMPLSACGTGLGQVLAMLYVVLTSQQPRTILIDEPQSFLHPGAVRKLIEILGSHQQHQFIVTTHSPTALLAADLGTVLRLRVDEGQTIIDRLDVAQSRDLRLILADVGARLSDVFGADNILWVEGQTEELCFPKVAAKHHILLRGTTIIGVVQTGDFEGRRSAMTIEVYRRLSETTGLLPPAVGFVFDREDRTAREQDDLKRYGNVHFLPRRMYENYLLDPSAIAAVAGSIQGFSDPPIADHDAEAWIDSHRWDPKYFDPLPVERDHDTWLREVRGGRLLTDLFSELSEQRVRYDKVRHGVAMTDWLLANTPQHLSDISELVARALE